MVTMDTTENVMLRPNPRLIPFTCTVASMDIMDMLDTLTIMDTMDTMESVKLRLIPFTCTVDCLDIMDTLESVKLRLNPRLIPFTCTVASMDIMDMLDTHTPMDTMDTLDRYPHPQMNLTQKLDTNAFFFSNLHISVLDFNTRIGS